MLSKVLRIFSVISCKNGWISPTKIHRATVMWPHLHSVFNTSPAAHCRLSVSSHPGPTFTDDGKESVLSHAPFSHSLVRLHSFTSALSGVSELFVSDSRQGATRDSRQKLSGLEEPMEELKKSWRICKTSMIAAFLLLVVQYFILHWTEVLVLRELVQTVRL